jgi:hypothetical protein
MNGIVVAEQIWTSTEVDAKGSVTTLTAAVTMVKAAVGWTVTTRCGPVARTTRHISLEGARLRYELGGLHTAAAMDGITGTPEPAPTFGT